MHLPAFSYWNNWIPRLNVVFMSSRLTADVCFCERERELFKTPKSIQVQPTPTQTWNTRIYWPRRPLKQSGKEQLWFSSSPSPATDFLVNCELRCFPAMAPPLPLSPSLNSTLPQWENSCLLSSIKHEKNLPGDRGVRREVLASPSHSFSPRLYPFILAGKKTTLGPRLSNNTFSPGWGV